MILRDTQINNTIMHSNLLPLRPLCATSSSRISTPFSAQVTPCQVLENHQHMRIFPILSKYHEEYLPMASHLQWDNKHMQFNISRLHNFKAIQTHTHSHTW